MNPAAASFLVTIVRHGETYMNSQKLLQGHSDAPLSEIGEEQAKKLGKAFAKTNTLFTSAYASDLQRAYNTAKLILGELKTGPEITRDVRLRERCYGDAEGKPVQELMQRAAEAKVSVVDFVPQGGESTFDVSQRAGDFFDELAKKSATATSTNAENVLVVSHGGWIITLMRYLFDNSEKYQLKNFSPTQAIRIHNNTGTSLVSITPTTSDSSKFEVNFMKVNDQTHLIEL